MFSNMEESIERLYQDSLQKWMDEVDGSHDRLAGLEEES